MDTGCSRSVVKICNVEGPLMQRNQEQVTLANGSRVFVGTCTARINVDDKEVTENCIVMNTLPENLDLLLGVDVIAKLGGMVFHNGSVKFGVSSDLVNVCSSGPSDELSGTRITEEGGTKKHNFRIRFDKVWTVSWDWKSDVPDQLPWRKTVLKESKPKDKSTMDILNKWMEKGYLIEYDDEKMGASVGSIPIYGIAQLNKDKIRPVFDFRELNKYIDVYSGSSDVCVEKLREWRRKSNSFAILDLSDAYMQIHVDPAMWRFQSCIINGKKFALTRMGFGLNTAPTIMTEIVRKVLSSDQTINAATGSYVDDIFVDESKVNADEVRCLFKKFGLECKQPERVNDVRKVRVLGVDVKNIDGSIMWNRSNRIRVKDLSESMSRRELYSLCGQLTGIYPIALWLRLACSFLKRTSVGDWDSPVDESVVEKVKWILERVEENDPCRGTWSIGDCKVGTLWCDASSIAMGVLLEVNGKIIEDGSWLRKKDDSRHINIAELEAVVKGLNLCAKWGMTDITIKCDNKSVVSWVNDVITSKSRLNTSAFSELLIRRRLSIIKEICDDFNIMIKIEFVASSLNKADEMTRIPKALTKNVCCVATTSEIERLDNLHKKCHLGAKRMKFLCGIENIQVTDKDITNMIAKCQKCQSIDPAPVKWNHGCVAVRENWYRLAIDVTKYNDRKYLSLIDCGPSRFAIWKEIGDESSYSISPVIDSIFFERGAPSELLVDNYTTFYSKEFVEVCNRWGVELIYRASNRPGGNGIVERNHRTIKRIAARSNITIAEAVWWYNNTPSENKEPPSWMIYSYKCMKPVSHKSDNEIEGSTKGKMYCDYQLVWVKPMGSTRCTQQWLKGQVLKKLSYCKYLVDCNGSRFPRHVADLRARRVECENVKNTALSWDTESEVDEPATTHVKRVRRRPKYLDDYVVDGDSGTDESGGDVG